MHVARELLQLRRATKAAGAAATPDSPSIRMEQVVMVLRDIAAGSSTMKRAQANP